MRFLKCVASVLFIFGIAALTGTFAPRPMFPDGTDDMRDVTIYVAASAIHTDIIIPADLEARSNFGFLQSALPLDLPNVRWLMFGWGGRSFYIETPQWNKLKAGPVLRALTIDTATIHVELLGDIDANSPTLTPVHISRTGLKRLQNEILASFKNDINVTPQLIADAAYGDFDQFYEANGYFNVALGCNTWTARMLRKAGVRTGFWNPFPQSLRISLKIYN